MKNHPCSFHYSDSYHASWLFVSNVLLFLRASLYLVNNGLSVFSPSSLKSPFPGYDVCVI